MFFIMIVVLCAPHNVWLATNTHFFTIVRHSEKYKSSREKTDLHGVGKGETAVYLRKIYISVNVCMQEGKLLVQTERENRQGFFERNFSSGKLQMYDNFPTPTKVEPTQ